MSKSPHSTWCKHILTSAVPIRRFTIVVMTSSFLASYFVLCPLYFGSSASHLLLLAGWWHYILAAEETDAHDDYGPVCLEPLSSNFVQASQRTNKAGESTHWSLPAPHSPRILHISSVDEDWQPWCCHVPTRCYGAHNSPHFAADWHFSFPRGGGALDDLGSVCLDPPLSTNIIEASRYNNEKHLFSCRRNN